MHLQAPCLYLLAMRLGGLVVLVSYEVHLRLAYLQQACSPCSRRRRMSLEAAAPVACAAVLLEGRRRLPTAQESEEGGRLFFIKNPVFSRMSTPRCGSPLNRLF